MVLQVITGIPLIELQIKERNHMYTSEGPTEEKRKTTKERIIELWTKHLIPNIRTWVDCKHINMTQVLTGHGLFQIYLKKIGGSLRPFQWTSGR